MTESKPPVGELLPPKQVYIQLGYGDANITLSGAPEVGPYILKADNAVAITAADFGRDMAKIVENMLYIVNGRGPFRIQAATEALSLARKYGSAE